jgi:lysophospholipase L1-like esterase
MRNFTLNFPLYQSVRGLAIGLDPQARIKAPAPYALDGRIVVYGTSITQGGCAARPGMAYTNILSRALNVEFINLGFSGNGRGEPEVCRTFAAIPDVRLFIFDYEANADGFDQFSKTLPENIRIVRKHHHTVPVLVVSRIGFAKDITSADYRQEHERTRDMQARVVVKARAKGDRSIYFLDGSTLLGDDFDECTVDGVHPTDLGFMRMARKMEPIIRKILGK